MTAPRSSALLCALLVLLAIGCSGRSEAERPGTPGQAEAAVTPAPQQASASRSLRATIQGSCRITATGALIRVEYSATAFGQALLARVRLLEGDQEVADSGPLEQRQFRKVATFEVELGEQRTYRVTAEAAGTAAAIAQTSVRCGTEPTRIPGPRV